MMLPESTASNRATPARWWTLYADPALDRMLEEVLAANADLRVALANLDQAHALQGEARAALLPSTGVSAGVARGRDQTSWGGPGSAPAQWNRVGGVELAYELDLFGRVDSDVAAAAQDAQAAAATLDAARDVAVARAVRAYVQACAGSQSLGLAQASVALAQRRLAIVARQEQAGSVSHLDTEHAAQALAEAQAAVPRLQAQREAALFEIAALMGRTPAQVPEAARGCDRIPQGPALLPVGDGAALLRRRPDVRAAERQLAADTSRIGVAVADLYPRITLGASASDLRNDVLGGNRAWSFSAGPLMTWSFPNITAARSRVAQAEARQRASLARFDGVVATALKESEQSLASHAARVDERDALVRAMDRAQSAWTLAEQRHRAGALSQLELISAQSDLTAARARLVAAEGEVGLAQVDVFRALGGAWDASAPALASAGP